MRICVLTFLFASFATGALAVSPESNINLPNVAGSKEVTILLPDNRPYGDRHAFPDIQNWNSLVIGLTRTTCFGTCPSYSVKIRGNGTVAYEGKDCVTSKGARFGHITGTQIRKLFEAFRKADFFSLRKWYNKGWVDAPEVLLSIKYDRWSGNVLNSSGTEGFPAEAAGLPDLIDSMANTARWVGKPGRNCSQQ